MAVSAASCFEMLFLWQYSSRSAAKSTGNRRLSLVLYWRDGQYLLSVGSGSSGPISGVGARNEAFWVPGTWVPGCQSLGARVPGPWVTG